jgi:hypothetical protein
MEDRKYPDVLKKSHSIKKKEDKYVARNNDQRVKTEH